MGGLLTRAISPLSRRVAGADRVDYRGYRVARMPAERPGVAALIALNALRDVDFSRIAAIRRVLAPADRGDEAGMIAAQHHVADPRFAEFRRALARDAQPPRGGRLGAAARRGDAPTPCISPQPTRGQRRFVHQQRLRGFRQRTRRQRLGFAMQNRGAGFSLNPADPNCIAPGKRPFHTIIPAMVLRDDEVAFTLGVSGGFMQPQGHVQLLVSLLDYGFDVQSAIDAPRFWWEEGRRVVIESGAPDATCATLARWGHDIVRREHRGMGGAQIIATLPGGVFAAGSEPRQDGCAIGY
jgi:gamma-glutamyltranspeptidase/glutathione hydrolase